MASVASRSGNDAKTEELVARVSALERLQDRAQERRDSLRQAQISIMMERNFYLSKVREIEEYGRRYGWGRSTNEPSLIDKPSSPVEGSALLRAIAAVLYDSRSNPATPRAR